MSGRRRRDDGWDEGRRDRDAAGSRPDPWADGGADGGRAAGIPRPRSSRRPTRPRRTTWAAPATATATDGTATATAAATATAGNDSSGYDAPGYGGRAGYGGQNGAANGYQSARRRRDTGGRLRRLRIRAGRLRLRKRVRLRRPPGFADANGATAFVPEFMSADADTPRLSPAGTPRPIGRLSIYTLLDDKVAEFDRLAERAAEGVRTTEPDTLVYVIHVVPKAPMQRIVYEIYRDRAAFESHERQPHIRRFMADRASLRARHEHHRLAAEIREGGGARRAPRARWRGRRPAGRGRMRSPRPGPRAGRRGDQSRSEQYNGSQYGNGSQYNGGQYGNGSQYGNGAQYNGDTASSPVQRRPERQRPVRRAGHRRPSAVPGPGRRRVRRPGGASFTPAAQDRYAAAASQYARRGGAVRPGRAVRLRRGRAGR